MIIECVPNLSEGRDISVINASVSAISLVKGIKLLDYSSDIDHNRSVFTFAGEPESVIEAALALMKVAVSYIDLNKHIGKHPRIGALDVMPFIPVEGISMEECIKFAREAARRIFELYNVPVYLYEYAATIEKRRNLADVRKGQFEGLFKRIEKDPPDFGYTVHPTAGACAVGARNFLVAFNVNLDTSDIKIAKAIASSIRERDGGLPCVKALGIMLESKNTAQVSMNLTNILKTSPEEALEFIKTEAEKYGVFVKETELIGLMPEHVKRLCAEHK